jgi:Lectin C-type domain
MALSTFVWTSAGDFGRSGDFFWDSTGEFIGPYVNWAENKPILANNTEHCIILWDYPDSYKWADTDCRDELLYICESNK